MGRLTWMLLVACCAVGCSRGKGGTASDPEFDRRWSALAAQETDTFYIEDDRGEGLMGNVRRTRRQNLALASTPKAVVVPPALDTPDPMAVQQVIRDNLASVKACFLRISREGDPRSGKAIVTFQIGAAGDVQDAKVDAPSFEGTSLSHCMGTLVSHWSFPKSEKGGLTISYPFVFVGGQT